MPTPATVNLTINLDRLDSIDLLTLFEAACEDGQFGDADVIFKTLIQRCNDFRDECASGNKDADDDGPG